MMIRKIRHYLHIVKRVFLYENSVIPAIYRFLCRIKILKPYVIVYVDGGICSQMHQYLLGRYYAEKGYHVAYDIGWYARNGKDNNGIHSRIFEFPQLWPGLPIEIASSEMVAFYSRVFPAKRNGMHFPLPITPPVYLQGYYFFDDEREYGAMYQRYFDVKSAMKMEKSSLITDWPGTKCAVHVRRGDLAQMNDVFYGKVTVDYFRKAISYVKNHFENVKFFFFSDEIEWVEENLYEFYKNSPYVLVRGNCAYEDLNLMAHCDCFISSQGSAGKVAAMMNGKGLLIVSSDPHDVVWKERYYNTFIIDV